MEDEDDDIHFCLVCNKTVPGLANYINHKKNECVGRKTKVMTGTAPQVAGRDGDSVKMETQSVSNYDNKPIEHLNQSESYGVFTTNQSEGYTDPNSFRYSGTIISAGETADTQLDASEGDFKKILSSTTQSDAAADENIFISTHMNIPDSTHMNNTGNIFSNTMPCNLSPIFSVNSTTKSTKQSDLTTDAEDYGILSASVTGNRNNIPIPAEGHMKVRVGDLPDSAHIPNEDGEHVDDFFQSLELMSKSDPRADRGSNFNQLPISNILNNLNFSDDEDLGFDFGDDMSLDSLSDGDDGEVPPGGHTGGKWRPGEKPSAYRRNRQRYRGKWRPGERPQQTAIRGRRAPMSRGKNISLIPGHKPKPAKKGRRSISNSGNKIYTCNFCDKSFVNRFQYSNHCSSKLHKEIVSECRDKIHPPEISMKASINKAAETVNSSDVQDLSQIQDNLNSNQDVVEGMNKEENKNESKSTDENESKITDGNESKVTDENDTANQDGYETDEYFEENKFKISQEIKAHDSLTEPCEEMEYQEVAMPVHICTVCDKKFINKYMIARHLLTKFHQNRSLAYKEEHCKLIQVYHKCIVRLSPFQCGICRFYFNTNKEFEKHLHTEEHKENCEDLVGEIQCTLCQFKTHSHDEVYEHLDSPDHIGRIERHNRICIIKECHAGCRCKFCGLKMHSFFRLQRHIKLKHSDGLIITGVQKRVIGVRNRPKCPECNVQMASVSSLAIHMRRRHSDEKPYKCEICFKAFADRHSHMLHLKSVLHNRRKAKQETSGDSLNEVKNMALKELKKEQKEDQVPAEKQTDGKEAPDEIEAIQDEENSKSAQVQLDDITNDTEHENIEGEEADKGQDGDTNWSPGKPRVGRKRRKGYTGEVYGYKQKDKNKTIKCNHCSFTAEDYNDLRPHYMKEHSNQIKICELCDAVYLSERAYKLHVLSKDHQSNIELSAENISGAKKYFQCHVCNKKFPDENYCKFHTAYQHFHSTTEAEVYKQNGFKSTTRDKFAGFLKSIEHVGHKEPLQCPECGMVVKKSNIMVHLRNHTDEKPFQCKICPKVFKSNYTLRKHLLKHFGCLERDCDICGRHFNKPSTYEEHMELHALEKANKEKTHICDFCGQAFYLERQLQTHLRRHKKKDMKCDHPGCHWTFAFRHELNAHKRTHGNERKYLCDTCGFAAFEKYHLRRHERIHQNERRFHCEYCTYKAGNKTHLRRHMRIHIGSKPFKCPYCSFACNTHENIRKHILETKKHEGLKVYPCKFCDFGTNSSKEFRGHLMSEHSKESDEGARQMPLSVFTGLFQKEEDIAKPAEGTQILPCKERRVNRKDQSEKAAENLNDSDEDWARNKSPGSVKKNRRKRKSDQVIKHNLYNQRQESPDSSQEAHDLSMKEGRIVYPPEMLKDSFAEVSQPYPTSIIAGRDATSPPFISNNIDLYQRFQGGVHTQLAMNTPLDLGIRHVQQTSHQLAGSGPGLSGSFPNQGYMKGNQEEMMQYHDYSTKFGVSRNREDAESNGNLIIDMNFQGHH